MHFSGISMYVNGVSTETNLRVTESRAIHVKSF